MGVFQRNGHWYMDYYTADGKRVRKKIGPNKSLAMTVLRKRKVEVAENKHLDIKREQNVYFEVFADSYLELYSKLNNRSWRKSDLHNVNTLKRYFAGKMLHEIRPEAIERFKADRLKEVSVARVNRNLSCLKCMFNRAIDWGKIEQNPMRKVKMLKETNTRLRYLEKEEIAKLLNSCSENLRPIIIVALNTGMRQGEILGLKWEDVDLKRGIIYLLNTKNGDRREVPMNKAVSMALEGIERDTESSYMFCDKFSKPYINVRSSFFTAMKKSGIINFRFHDLRHTAASHLVMAGVDLNTVRELLGHKSLGMTLRYAHLSQDHKKRAVAMLSTHIDSI